MYLKWTQLSGCFPLVARPQRCAISVRCHFAAGMVSVAGNCFRSRIRVYHKDTGGVLHSLQNFELSERILDGIARGKRCVNTQSFSRGDMEKLAQIGLGAASEVDLIVEFLWDVRSFMAILETANNAQLRRRVLEMALNRFRRTPILSKILTARGCPAVTLRENPYLKRGHPPYENFIQSLLSITADGTPRREKLFELFLESAADEADVSAFTSVEERGVRTVFHGTNHAVMDAILNSGLDPNCRRVHREDYFGLDHNTSLEYTVSKTTRISTVGYAGYKLLVFMIIVDSGIWPYSGAITVASNCLQLPLAEITL